MLEMTIENTDTSATALLSGAAPTATPAPVAETTPVVAATDTPPAGDAPPAALSLPSKDATPEQWSEFYKAVGRPETPDAYELPIPEGDSGDFAKAVAPMLHKHGLSADQAKGLAADWNEMQAAQVQAMEAAETARIQAMDTTNKAEAAALKTEWGSNHDANMHFAKQAVSQFIPEGKAADVIGAIESKLGYAATIKFLHGIGKGFAEHDAAGLGSDNRGSAEVKSVGERLYPNSK
jgi:hypothetical protein